MFRFIGVTRTSAIDRDLEDGEFSVNTTLSLLQHVQHFYQLPILFFGEAFRMRYLLPIIGFSQRQLRKILFTGYLFYSSGFNR